MISVSIKAIFHFCVFTNLKKNPSLSFNSNSFLKNDYIFLSVLGIWLIYKYCLLFSFPNLCHSFYFFIIALARVTKKMLHTNDAGRHLVFSFWLQ